MKLSKILKKGDIITVYQKRGSNWRLSVLDVDDGRGMALLDPRPIRPNMGPGWYEIKISKRGIPYAEG